MKSLRLLLIVSLTLIALSLAAETARKIPGVTVKDQFPRGCVDCHTGAAGHPAKMSAIMKQWSSAIDGKRLARLQTFVPKTLLLKGKHPPVGSVKDVPAVCIKCHAAMAKIAPTFAPLMHGIHLTGGDANPFLTTFQGECTHCHKLDAVSGKWSNPSAAEK